MIALQPSALRFLKHGRTVQVHATGREYRKGRIYRARANKTTSIQVKALEAKSTEAGWDLLITLHQPRETVRYLAADPGANRDDYTTNPSRAAREPVGPIEAAPTPTQKPSDPYNRRSPRYAYRTGLPFKPVERT